MGCLLDGIVRMMSQKAKARKAIQIKLSEIDDRAYINMQQLVYRSIVDLLHQTAGIKRALLYRSFSQWRETNLAKLKDDFVDIDFIYAPITKDADLPTDIFDIIFVPLYGFNQQGYRLGHGSGWYDKLLSAQTGALKVGVGFEACQISFTPEPHDIPMDIIVTESQVRSLTTRS